MKLMNGKMQPQMAQKSNMGLSNSSMKTGTIKANINPMMMNTNGMPQQKMQIPPSQLA
jgi:hypothetical protein